jgi:ribosomal protein S18 acetylase RimI-like enzyme
MCATASTQLPALDATDTASVCHALAQALIDDPFYRAVTVAAGDDEVRRLQMLARYCELAMAEGQAIGEIQHAGTDGAAIWITTESSEAEVARHGAARNRALETLLGAAGYANYSRMCAAMAQHVPDHLAQAWYLSILGVRPEARGRRLAQRMLEITLNRADQIGVASFLETFNPLSIPFYERLGFKQEKRCVEEVAGQPYWIMSRRGA